MSPVVDTLIHHLNEKHHPSMSSMPQSIMEIAIFLADIGKKSYICGKKK